MSLIGLALLGIAALVVIGIFLIMKKVYKLGVTFIVVVAMLGFIYTNLPDYWQASIRLTIALSTNGAFSKMESEQVDLINKGIVTVKGDGKFTWVKPVTEITANTPEITADNLHEFNIDFFTTSRQTLGYEIHYRYVDEAKVLDKLTKLGIVY